MLRRYIRKWKPIFLISGEKLLYDFRTENFLTCKCMFSL